MKVENSNHFPDQLKDFFKLLKCYHPDRHETGFRTDCDWKALGLFIFLYVIAFVILLVYQYRCLTRKHKCVCGECLCARRLLFCAKFFLYIIVEIGNKFMERPLCNMFDWLNYGSEFTLFVFIIISAVEAIFVSSIASCATRYFMYYISFQRLQVMQV